MDGCQSIIYTKYNSFALKIVIRSLISDQAEEVLKDSPEEQKQFGIEFCESEKTLSYQVMWQL